jgi:hypothetical protein
MSARSNLIALAGALTAGLLGAGCNLLVGVGDYAAGSAPDSSVETGGGEGGMMTPDAPVDMGTGGETASDDGPASVDEGGDGGDGGRGGRLDAALDGPGFHDARADAAGDGGGCGPDTTVSCVPGDGVGYTCPGTNTPDVLSAYYDCGYSVSSTATTSSYCCWTCSQDSAVTGCQIGTTAYSCLGTDSPADDFSYTCTSASNAGGGVHGYCCSTVSPTSCTTSYDCYGTNAVCNKNTGKCQVAAGAIGDPCGSNADCTGAGVTCGNHWCLTSSCSTNASCGTASTGLANQCQGSSECFPSCSSNNDCYPYSNTFCVPTGATYGVCSITNGGIGDPCSSSTDCTGSTTFCNYSTFSSNACSQACTSTSDTSCGTNANGKTNRCVYSSYDSQYECFAGCTSDADCIQYGGGTGSCMTTTSGGSVCM